MSDMITVVRLCLGTMLAVLGVVKIVDFGRFTSAVRLMVGVNEQWATLLAWFVVTAEVIVGAALLLNMRPQVGLVAAGALFGLFAAAVLPAAIDGRAVPCGCYGRWSPSVTRGTVLRNLMLALVSLSAARLGY